MKLGNLITLTIFTLLSIFMIIQGYPQESSESLLGGILFIVCLYYWTTYFNRYRLGNKEIKYLKMRNRELKLQVEAGSKEFELSEEINKLNNKRVKVLEDLIKINDNLIDTYKESISSRDIVISKQEEIIKEYIDIVSTSMLSYSSQDKLEKNTNPVNNTIAEVVGLK